MPCLSQRFLNSIRLSKGVSYTLEVQQLTSGDKQTNIVKRSGDNLGHGHLVPDANGIYHLKKKSKCHTKNHPCTRRYN